MSRSLRIGVDVGGTNTDAVLLQGSRILAEHKSPTTPDVGSGVLAAIRDVLGTSGVRPAEISGVMIGTTHFTNAFVEARSLASVGVLRLAAPASMAVRPLVDWPKRLLEAVTSQVEIVRGGYNYDGRAIAPLDEAAVRRAALAFKARSVGGIAICSVFAPVNPEQELRAAQIIREEWPDARLTLSSEIGRIGFIERENAAVMNAALTPMAERVVSSFWLALRDLGIATSFYISQNDGTLLSPDSVARHPVLTFASGPTNSMRGAALLSAAENALVMDIGGTTTDVGALVNGFPRESAIAVDIGGVRTNFRMPDLLSIGLGGGSLVVAQQGRVSVGPRSVGYRIREEALVFGGKTLTATDVAVAAGYADVGDRDRVRHLDRKLVDAGVDEIHRLAEDALDRMKTGAAAAPMILVGGGSVLINRELRGASSLTVPEHACVANALGASIAQVSGEIDRVYSYEKLGREEAMRLAQQEASGNAVASGAAVDSVRIVDIEELPLQYLPGAAVRLRVKAVGDLALQDDAA